MGNELHAELVNEDQCEYLDSYYICPFFTYAGCSKRHGSNRANYIPHAGL